MKPGLPDDMYREEIMELYKSPENYGDLPGATHSKTAHNSVCGDEITINMVVKDGKVKDIRYSGSGCVIAMVSSSLLTSKIRGMKTQDINGMTGEDALALLRTKLNPARMKCALLALEAAKGALKDD